MMTMETIEMTARSTTITYSRIWGTLIETFCLEEAMYTPVCIHPLALLLSMLLSFSGSTPDHA